MSIRASYSEYVTRLIPLEHRWKLQQVLDYSNDYDTHLIEIAKHIIDWEEKLASPFQLTPVEIHDIKEKRNSPQLTRREVLRVWKSKNMLKATYGRLLEKCLLGGDTRTAEIICDLLASRQIGEDQERLEVGPFHPIADQISAIQAEQIGTQNGTHRSQSQWNSPVQGAENGNSSSRVPVRPPVSTLWDRDAKLVYLQLIKYVDPTTGDHEQLKILTELAPDWKDIATTLGFGNNNVRSVENPGSGKLPHDCLRMVISSWLDDSLCMSYPGTWAGVRQLLLDSSHSKLAQKLEAAVSAKISTLHHNCVETEEALPLSLTVVTGGSTHHIHGPVPVPGMVLPVPSTKEEPPSKPGLRSKLNYEELATWLGSEGIDPQDIEIIRGEGINERVFLATNERSPRLKQVSQITKAQLLSLQDSLRNS